MSMTEMQEKPYLGLLGLDRVSPMIKAINFIVTVILVTVLPLYSWFFIPDFIWSSNIF